MNKLYEKFTDEDLIEIAKVLNTLFPCVHIKRIYELLLQVDSIDTTWHLLMCHSESEYSLDHIVYEHLHYKDNKKC